MARARRRRSREANSGNDEEVSKKSTTRKKASDDSKRLPKQTSSRNDEAKTSSRKSQKLGATSSRKSKSRKSKKTSPRQRLSQEDREQMELDKDRKTTKTVIIIASIIVLALVGIISANILFLNAAYDKVLKTNVGDDVGFKDYLKNPSINELAGYGTSAIGKVLDGLDEQIANDGSESLKKNLIATLAAAFKKNRSLSDSNAVIERLKTLIMDGEGDTKSFAILALAYVPSGINELGNIVKSSKSDTNTSWQAFNSLLESKDKIPGDVLIMALNKQDDAFVTKVLPVIQSNINEFSENPDALTALFKTIKDSSKENATIAIGLLGQCIKGSQHYQVLKNKSQSKNKRVQSAALEALLDLSPINGAMHWADLVNNSKNEEILLKVLPKLGSKECQEYYKDVIVKLTSDDIKVVEAAIKALGNMKNSPNKGLIQIIPFLTNDNLVLKKAAILATAGFAYLAPYNYSKTPDTIPTFKLMKNINSKDKEIQDATISALQKMYKKSYNSSERWIKWWIQEKSALEMVVQMEKEFKAVSALVKARNWKAAKTEVENLTKTHHTLLTEYIHRWKAFSKYLSKREMELVMAKGLIYKNKGVMD